LEDADMIEFFKKPWWVGPLVAGLAFGHQGTTKPAGPAGVTGYEKINNRGPLPRNGSVVVVATCPAGKRVISGGGHVVPSFVGTTDLSRPDGDNAWRVHFKSNGGSGNATVYAICVTAN
jgi:hypothetical protein